MLRSCGCWWWILVSSPVPLGLSGLSSLLELCQGIGEYYGTGIMKDPPFMYIYPDLYDGLEEAKFRKGYFDQSSWEDVDRFDDIEMDRKFT